MQKDFEIDGLGLWRRGIRLWLALGTVALIGGLFPYWPLSLFGHFRVQALVLFLLFAVSGLVLRDRVSFSLSALLSFLLAFSLANSWTGPPRTDGASLRLVLVNFNAANKNYRALERLVEQENPDVLVVLEVRQHHVATLKRLGFPHQSVVKRADNFGVAMLSQFKPKEVRVERFGPELPTLVAEFEDFRLLATHPYPPVSRVTKNLADQQLKWLEQFLSGDQPVVLTGDLNASSWTYRVKRLERAGLVNARRGFGVLPTWPVPIGWLRIPIDHILVSPEIGVGSLRVGPDVGSDHLPLVADLVVRPSGARNR